MTTAPICWCESKHLPLSLSALLSLSIYRSLSLLTESAEKTRHYIHPLAIFTLVVNTYSLVIIDLSLSLSSQ